MQALNQIKLVKLMVQASLAKVFILASLIMAFLSLAFSTVANALEFRSVAAAKAVLYDAPSVEATKIYILNAGYPVEIIVDLRDWLKVRDQLGGLSWIENKHLSAKRTVLVTEKTDIKATEDASAALLATVEKDVTLELISPVIQNGWVKVKHRDGIIGFVQASALWGVN